MNAIRETITPERAREMLTRNTCNRPVSARAVARYAKIMTEGRWVENGDTIRFNKKGELVDGQHRLHAIIRANKNIITLVAYHVDDNAFATIDSGKQRTGADTLAVIGEKNAIRLSSILPLIERYNTGRADTYVKFDNDEILKLHAKYPDVKELLAVTHKFKKGLLPPSVLGACFYLFSKVDAKLADEFVERVVEGVNVEKNSSWYYLRERLIRNSTAKAKVEPIYLMALCIKAWNFARRKESVKYLRWRETGEKAEAFPLIQ